MKEIKLNKLDEVVYYDKTKSGLDIYMVVNEKVNNYYATLNVLYGSVHTNFKVKDKEYSVPNGVAHFLEHVNFNEEDGKTAHEYFDKLGTSINAATTFDYTSYEIFGTNDIGTNINHLLDYVLTPCFTKELVEKEKGIIIEEVNMGSNNPGSNFYYATNRILFHNNKRINLITGTCDDVNKIKVDDLKNVYNAFYHPSNMFLVVTGNFNPYEVAALVKENQDNKNFKEFVKPKIIKDKEIISVVKDYQEIRDNIEIPKVSINYKLSRKSFSNIKSDSLLISYLNVLMFSNFGSSSDFKEELMENELITSINTSSQIIDDMVIINILCETKYPSEVIEKVKDNMTKLNISKEKLARKSKVNIAYLITSFDDIEDVNDRIQFDIVNYKEIINNRYNLYKNLNIDEVNYIIKHLDLSNCAVLVQKPLEKK